MDQPPLRGELAACTSPRLGALELEQHASAIRVPEHADVGLSSIRVHVHAYLQSVVEVCNRGDVAVVLIGESGCLALYRCA